MISCGGEKEYKMREPRKTELQKLAALIVAAQDREEINKIGWPVEHASCKDYQDVLYGMDPEELGAFLKRFSMHSENSVVDLGGFTKGS